MPAGRALSAHEPGLARLLATAFVPFGAGYFVSYVYRSLNLILGPTLSSEIGLNAASLGALTSAYFAAFAAFQIPLGMLLDRYGPRRVEAALLLIATLGALIFAIAETLGGLVVARALIGVGVSGCLMAAFKANVQFWPSERLPLVNGCLMGFGGLGATFATLPIEIMLGVMSWRAIFVVIAAVTIGVAAAIYFIVPERTAPLAGSLGDQLADVIRIYRAPVLWRYAPLTIGGQAVHLAYPSLWAGPWLRDIGGLDRATVANQLFIMMATMIPGYMLTGIVADRLLLAGMTKTRLFILLNLAFLVVQAPLVAGWAGPANVMWLLFCLLGAGTMLTYAFLSQAFPPQLAGRVFTAVNLLVFSGAFAVQAGVGAVINLFPATATGYAPEGHKLAFLIVLLAQAAGLIWFVLPRWDRTPDRAS